MPLATGCAPEATVVLEAPLEIDEARCVAGARREGPVLFDLRRDAGFPLLLAFSIDVTNTDAPYGVLKADTLAWFSLESEPIWLTPLPTSPATARRRGQGTDFASDGGPVSAFVVEVTSADVAALLNDPLASSLRTPADRLPLRMHIDVDAVVAPIDDVGGMLAAVSAGDLIVPIDLCVGCLVPDCEGELTDAGCFRGVDLPSACSD